MDNLKSGGHSSATAEPFVHSLHEAESPPLADHLAGLPCGKWNLWRWVVLRSAGFPVSQALKLSAPESAATADKLILAEEDAKEAQVKALEMLKVAIKSEADGDRLRCLRKALSKVREGKVPAPLAPSFAQSAAIESFRTTSAAMDSTRSDFNRKFEEEVTNVSAAIYDVASDDRFREALLWQNRHAVHKGIHSFLKDNPRTASRGSIRRRNEEMIASYIQRYSVKNDSIGFFGPVSWAKVVPEAKPLTARPGPSLVAGRLVYLEGWCIDALAEMLSRDKRLRPWMSPRLLPFYGVSGDMLYKPLEPPTPIPVRVVAVLKACDGLRTASEIASELTRNPAFGLEDEESVFALLDYLNTEGLILWAFEYPVGPEAEQDLRRLVERIQDCDLRAQALNTLNEIRSARVVVDKAAGNAEKLDEALGHLEETFTWLTGVASTRSAGEMYAARTLIYEDCRRDLEVTIGTELLESLGPPLSLILSSARWFTFEAAQLYRRAFAKVYDEIACVTGTQTLDAVSFWQRVQPLFFDEEATPAKSLIPVLQQRWSEILGIASGQRRVSYTSDELRSRVLSAFDAPAPGWRLGSYHSPDIMIAATSPDAIEREDFQFVMGELHMGFNTLRAPTFLQQHPSPTELFEAIERDLPEPCVVPIPPRHWPGITSRTTLALVPPKDFRLALSYDAAGFPQSQTLPIGGLVIERSGDGLIARTHDGRVCFDIIELFGELLSLSVVNLFSMLPSVGHTPRVTVDRLVACREAWRVTAHVMQFAYDKSEAGRFLGARRWMREHKMPRFVFVKAPAERKPFFVDFESPVLVNLFAKTVRRCLESDLADRLVTVSEMLPAPDQTWLPDAEGQRYTSEFRFVAIGAA